MWFIQIWQDIFVKMSLLPGGGEQNWMRSVLQVYVAVNEQPTMEINGTFPDSNKLWCCLHFVVFACSIAAVVITDIY